MNGAPILTPAGDGPKSGILILRDAVAAYFEEHNVLAAVAPVGLKYRSFTLNQGPGGANRLVFIPGIFDGQTGTIKPRKYGEITRKTRNLGSGSNPREIAEWDRPITVSVWGAPVPGRSDDEGLSLGKCEDLLEQMMRALQRFGGSIVPGEVLINAPPVENGFGAELLVGLTQVGPLYDEALEYVQANVVPSRTVTT